MPETDAQQEANAVGLASASQDTLPTLWLSCITFASAAGYPLHAKSATPASAQDSSGKCHAKQCQNSLEQ